MCSDLAKTYGVVVELRSERRAELGIGEYPPMLEHALDNGNGEVRVAPRRHRQM